MNPSHPSSESKTPAKRRDEITVLRCTLPVEPWTASVDEFARWLDAQIAELDARFAEYSTVSGRRKAFSR